MIAIDKLLQPQRIVTHLLGDSLNTRLLTSVGLLLVMFFSVTVTVLDYEFRQVSLTAIRDRLDVEALALMAASDERVPGKLLPSTLLLDSRFLSPNSGLYGQISLADGAESWQSPSLLGAKLAFAKNVRPGEKRFGTRVMSNGTRVLALSVGYSWEFSNGAVERLIFSVAESQEPYYEQLRQFRVQLFGGFAALAVLLIAALGLLLRRVLKPLRRIEQEIKEIEAGRLAELGAGYPRELVGATSNMNALLHNERERMARYRNTLGNLAHSLKTPLAVIRNLLAASNLQNVAEAKQLDEQVGRMDDIVRYQLKRAAASAGTSLGSAPIALYEAIEPLRNTLQKVYFERGVHCELDIPQDCRFPCDKGDLMEITGNLLDNAFKYGRQIVKLSAQPLLVPGSRRDGVMITVEDDGPGIAPDKRQQVLERGTRLDERQSGQGIGLSVVREVAKLYRGDVEIGESSLGGAKLTVRLLGA